MIAIITGATGDIGEAFVKALVSKVDSIWAVGRNMDKLDALSQKYDGKIVPIKTDLTDIAEIRKLCNRIDSVKPEIMYLINNAGIAKMDPVSEFSYDLISDLLDVNTKAATLLCRAAIPYMAEGSYIFNIASASAFQPNPYIALYSASKSYLLSFTRSLNMELKGVTCTAVCPGWVDTKMLPKENNGKKIDYPGIVTSEKVVSCALKDGAKGKDVSVCSSYYRYLRFYSKVMPHKIVMKQWIRSLNKHV
ncbi:MAG: SDR family NAD(P)-dependent oxidoreductase [Clostridiales bacterium]|nr:SDR family NAD(P)-dependent oxidoreductase [Clostridiales bacterium]